MILIVGSGRDPHVQSVLRRLSETKSETTLLDAYELDSEGFSDVLSDKVELSIGRGHACLAEFTSVWWRQKAKPEIPSDCVLDYYDYGFVQREWNTIFDFLAAKTEFAFSVNDRRRAKLAENKAFQLDVARDFDFCVPRTIITSSTDHAVRFFEQAHVSRCVYKSFSPYMPPNATMAYTTELNMAELCKKEFQETRDATPGIFQELIEPDHELRVTIVGDTVFSARIDSPNGSGIDWRTSLFKNKYSHVTLPTALEEELLRFHAKLGLVFAAYDFIVTKSQDIYFLEANPSGQWMWIEEQLGVKVSDAIAGMLRRA